MSKRPRRGRPLLVAAVGAASVSMVGCIFATSNLLAEGEGEREDAGQDAGPDAGPDGGIEDAGPDAGPDAGS